jgi:hypothetical protein
MPNGVEACQAAGLADRTDMESFMFAFDNNLKPVVGQQVTLTRTPSAQANARLALLVQQAEQGHCDLVAHGGGAGFVYEGGKFLRHDGTKLTPSALVQRVTAPLTFTAVPPREGRRCGVDRDEDGVLDAFDRRLGR